MKSMFGIEQVFTTKIEVCGWILYVVLCAISDVTLKQFDQLLINIQAR